MVYEEDVFSCKKNDDMFSLEEVVIINTCEGESQCLSSDNHERDLMKDELDVQPDAFPFEVHLELLVGGTKNSSFDKNTLSYDLSTTRSLEKNPLNEVVPKHMETKIASMSNTKFDIRDT